MPQHSTETDSAAQFAILLLFSYGATPTIKRWARYTDDITISTGNYAGTYTGLLNDDEAAVTTSVNYGQQTGGTTDDPVEITIPSSVEPVNRLIAPYEWAETTVDILECDPDDPTATLRLIYSGVVSQAIGNAEGRRGVSRLILAGPRSKFKDIPLGLAMGDQCNNFGLGQRECGYDLEANKQTGTVTAINVDGDPRRITATLSGSDYSNAWFNSGRIVVDGLGIKIRSVDESTPKTFNLSRIPPPTWASASCEAYPGCDLTIGQCRFFNQEETFRGLGGSPYNVLFEGPA